MSLEPLPLETATNFLLQRTGQDDAPAARRIAEAVGGVPLALEQAAAYLVENDWRSLADYAQLLQSRMRELLQEGKPEDYPLPVASTWDLSFQRIEQAQPTAADLLRLCAFMAPDDIPISVLRTTEVALPGTERSLGPSHAGEHEGCIRRVLDQIREETPGSPNTAACWGIISPLAEG